MELESAKGEDFIQLGLEKDRTAERAKRVS